jgi:hypothetical protein
VIRRFLKNSSKFGKIRPIRSGADGGTINFLKPEFRPVLLNYRPNSPRNRRLFPKIGLVIPGRFLQKPVEFSRKLVIGTKKNHEKQ